jgi:hypothetical protein
MLCQIRNKVSFYCSGKDRETCQDQSDRVFSSDKCQEPFLRYCKDNKTCIHENIFCDGHEQCEDGSDEDLEFCQDCPR